MTVHRARLRRRAAFLLALPLLAIAPGAEGQQQQRRPLPVEGRQTLFQRVILRPGAILSERPEAGAPSRPAPGFSVFYVYARQGAGEGAWLEVGGAQDGRTDGWVPAAKARCISPAEATSRPSTCFATVASNSA